MLTTGHGFASSFLQVSIPATRQLLAMLTPQERSVALNLPGYPEDSIGRLMTPNYVSVREQWTISVVLDLQRRLLSLWSAS